MKSLLTIAVLLSSLLFSAETEAKCGKVTIAEMNWPSASVIAHFDALILKHGFDCKVDVITGDTMPTGTSMIEKGVPDIAPEFWTNNFKEALSKGIKEKRLNVLGNAFSDGGEEGFWVPEYLVKKDPSIATIAGVIKNAKLFKHPEDPNKSAFMTCPAGWGCQITNNNMFRALKLEAAGFDIVDPGSGAGLAGAIAKAYGRKQAWFGYYWAPTAVLGKYPMVKVDFGVTDKEHFSNCLTQKECANPKPSMYPPSPVKTLVVQDFVNRVPNGAAYLAKRSYSNALMNSLLAWKDNEQADGETAAINFLKNHEKLWAGWLPNGVASKVKSAVTNL
jgi:glycine betaine/proline transport system substrate-binding protein